MKEIIIAKILILPHFTQPVTGGRASRLLLGLTLILSSALHPQAGLAQWLHYANRNQVRAVEFDAGSSALWYATGGGLVRLDLERNLYQEFGRSEGLPCAGLTGLVILPDGRLLAGTADIGICLRTASGRWVGAGVFDGLPDDRVYCLVPAVSTNAGSPPGVWVGTERGARKMTVGADFLEPERGGSVILENYAVYDVAEIPGGAVFFGTSSGLWRMEAAGNFARYDRENGLNALKVTDVEPGPGGVVYLNADGFLQRLSAGSIQDVPSPFGAYRVMDLRLLDTPDGEVLAVAAGKQEYFLAADGQWSSGPEFEETPFVIGPMVGESPAVGTDASGIYWPAGDQADVYQNLIIPGPLYNLLTAVAVDSRGTVWISSAADGLPFDKVGLSRFDGQSWTHFNEASSPLIYNLISAIDIAPDDRVYLGTFFGPSIGAGGINILDDGGTADPAEDRWESYIANECELSTGVIRGDIAFDADGGAWIGSQFNFDLPGGLEYFDSEERVFFSYSEQLAERNVRAVAVDGLKNVWIGYLNRGLAVIPGGRGSAYQVRQVESFTQALRGETGILDLAVDRVNRLWIATGGKVVLLNFQEDAVDEEKFVYQEIKPPSYAGFSVNSIVFEDLTAAWFGTRSGIFRLELATDHWTVFNRASSPLAADEVAELFLDGTRGVLWAATSEGLSALSLAEASASGTAAAKLIIRPNPWHPVSEGLLSISGIPRYSRVTILTVSGEPVRRFDPRDTINRLLFWDGTNQHGAPCASGVYLIQAESPEGQNASGTVALIR